MTLRKLGEIASLSNGRFIEAATYSPMGQFPVFGANGPIGRAITSNTNTEVIVIGRVGAYCGSVHRTNGPAWVTDNALKCQPIGDTDFDYLFYLLTSLGLNEHAGGSAQPLLTQGLLRTLDVPNHSPQTQRLIGQTLRSFDKKIQVCKNTAHTLEEMSQALFKSWFVDFDPVVAKSEGRKPFGMSDDIAALFPDSFEESELGAVPKGWRVGTIHEIGENPRRAVKPSDLPPHTPYFGLEHLPRKQITLNNWGHAAGVVSGKLRFYEEEILFGKLRPYFHKVGLAPIDGVCSTDILVLRPKAPEWLSFLLAHVSSSPMIDYVDAASGGTRMPRTDWRTVGSYQIVIPPLELATAFNNICRPLYLKGVHNTFENRLLHQIRDVLLPHLLSEDITEMSLKMETTEVVAV